MIISNSYYLKKIGFLWEILLNPLSKRIFLKDSTFHNRREEAVYYPIPHSTFQGMRNNSSRNKICQFRVRMEEGHASSNLQTPFTNTPCISLSGPDSDPGPDSDSDPDPSRFSTIPQKLIS